MDSGRWDRNGSDAVYFVRGLKSGTIDGNDKAGFLRSHKALVEKYGKRRLGDNFKNLVKRWEKFKKDGSGKWLIVVCNLLSPFY